MIAPRLLVIVVGLAAAAGCGKPPSPVEARRAVGDPVPARPTRPERYPDDVVVARVDGLPVYASCVALLAPRHHALPPAQRARAALDECVAFELLAREAAARGLAADPEVVHAARSAAANRLVELEIDDKIRAPQDLPRALVERFLARNRWRLQRVEYRASFFVRFPVAKGAPAGGAADLAARDAAQRVAAALASERGLFPSHVKERARALAGVHAMEEGDVDLSDAPRLVPAYSDALFAIPEVGRTSPAVRTDWGWDVILWTSVLPARTITAQQLIEELFPELRQAYFASWSKAIGKATAVELYPEVLERTSARSPGSAP